MRAAEPVVFAYTRKPAAASPAAISLVTVDLPRVPLTRMRMGTALRRAQ